MDDFYVSHSRFSDPGAQAAWLDTAPRDIAALREAASQLVFHYWASGDIAAHGFPADGGRTRCPHRSARSRRGAAEPGE